MKISELSIIYGFKGEAVFFDLHTFISKNGAHSLNDFYTTALFAVNDYFNNIITLNDFYSGFLLKKRINLLEFKI